MPIIPMTIQLNGNSHHLDTSADSTVSVETLLSSIGLAEKPVVVELNQQALFPREYPHSTIQDGDQIEIITIAAGG